MSVDTIKTRLAYIQKNRIAGVKRAFAQPPTSLNRLDLPAFANFTGPAQHNWVILGSDTDQETRTYLMRLYVAAIQQGVAPGEAERLCEPFFPLVQTVFSARPGLEQLTGVQVAALLGDSGVTVLTLGGDQFVGIEFRLQVTEYVKVIYADYE